MSMLAPADPAPFDIRRFGAIDDGSTPCTGAFAAAIEAASNAGGGAVVVPAGRYVTGSIFLQSHVTLHVDAGATILGSEDPADYPLVDTDWEGQRVRAHAGLIAGRDLDCIAITGRGTIDGRGAVWWEQVWNKTLEHPRPRLINLLHCRDVLIEGVTLRNSPAWTVHPLGCENVVLDRVTVINPPDSPNTDGLNPDSCRNVRISNCCVDVGDDCITIKAGSEARQPSQPCENILVTNCVLQHGHGGVVIGSEMSGGVRNVVISNCVFDRTDRGIRIKTRRGRGGRVEDIRVSNVIMRRVACPFTVNMYYRCGLNDAEMEKLGTHDAQPVDAGTPSIRNIHLSHITAREIMGTASGCMLGLAESPIAGVSLDDVELELAPDPAADAATPAMSMQPVPDMGGSFLAEHVRNLRLRDVRVIGREGARIVVREAGGLVLDGVQAAGAQLSGVQGGAVRGCRNAAGTSPMPIDADAGCTLDRDA